VVSYAVLFLLITPLDVSRAVFEKMAAVLGLGDR